MTEIPIPRRPRTSIEFGSIRGGTSFNTRARKASLRFEIRSESASQVRLLRDRINTIAAEVKSRAGAEVHVDIIARRKPGGISLDHPLAKTTLEVMDLCGIEPRIFPSTSELSALIDKKIPAVTLGITRGENIDDRDESILLEPMIDGLSQLLGVLASFDRDTSDED